MTTKIEIRKASRESSPISSAGTTSEVCSVAVGRPTWVPERFTSPDELFESPPGGLRKILYPPHGTHVESRLFFF
jgi:hypothetical protein